MCANGECTPEHREFINHLMGCRSCYAPTHNYCSEGLALRMENDSSFIAGLTDLAERRRWMEVARSQYGQNTPLIEVRVREIYEARRKAALRAG